MIEIASFRSAQAGPGRDALPGGGHEAVRMQTWPRPLRSMASSDHGVQRVGHQTGIEVTAHALQAKTQGDVIEIIDAQAGHVQVGSGLRSARKGFAVCHVINCV